MDDLGFHFRDVAIKHNKMILFKAGDAITLIQKCYDQNKSVYGVDAFILNEPFIQPFMEHSINAREGLSSFEQMDIFVIHLKKYLDSEFVFEVVYEGY